jgi:DNA mismatch repair ATPase MutS
MSNATPMLRQYLEIKKQYPGTLLFFRLGDFYELFNEDAVTGARELEITLTARHKDTPHPIPMCGVPHHAAAGYISRLVKKGYRVAVCEQTEEAGNGKKLVKREVVRVITPGTAIDTQLLERKEPIFLATDSARLISNFRPESFSLRKSKEKTLGRKSAPTSKVFHRASYCFPKCCRRSSKARFQI